MIADSPEIAFQGMRVGYICDRCNRGIRNGDPVRFYGTRYDDTWVLRRLYCSDCGEATVSPPTDTADEVIGEAVWFQHTLRCVAIIDQSRPC